MKEVKENSKIPMVVSGEVQLMSRVTQKIIVLTEIMLTILSHEFLFHSFRYTQAFIHLYNKLLPYGIVSLTKYSGARRSLSILLLAIPNFQ